MIPPYRKYPDEQRTLAFNFATKLATSDSVASISGVTASAGVTLGTPSLSGSVVSVRVSGGTVPSDYTIVCKVNTAGGDLLELRALLEVRSDAN